MATKMTAAKVLEATTPAAAAKRFFAFLVERYEATEIFLWSPEETKDRGWGSGWSVCWESGPFEWTSVSGGGDLYGPELGNYSSPGPFPNGLSGPDWHAEPYNGFVMGFYK